MNHIIIATHYKLAQGFFETIQYFNQSNTNIEYINAYVENNEFERELKRKIEKNMDKNIVVLTDIPGGSVNQIAMKLMKEMNFILITGINFSLILELVFLDKIITAEIADNCIEKAKNEMICINNYSFSNCDDKEL